MLTRRHKLLVVFSSLLVALLLFLLWLPPQLRSGERHPWEVLVYVELEHQLLHKKLQLPPTPRPTEQIAVVSFGWRATKIFGPLPWPRDLFADLLTRLRRLGAKTIVMDPLFSDAQLRFLSPAAFKSLFPALPLEQISIVNPFNHVGELKTKLARAEKELIARAKDNQEERVRLELFLQQRDRLLLLAERIADGDANLAFETAVAARRDVVFPTDYSNIPTFTRSPREALARWETLALPPFAGSDRDQGLSADADPLPPSAGHRGHGRRQRGGPAAVPLHQPGPGAGPAPGQGLGQLHGPRRGPLPRTAAPASADEGR